LELKGAMGGLYRITEWIMRLTVTNLLWFFCSLPVFFIVFLGLIAGAEDAGSFFYSLIAAGVLAPFLLFPATAALFTVTRKWVMGDEDVPMFKTFFRGYKENYKQSLLGGLLLMAVVGIIAVNFFYYNRLSSSLSAISIVFIIFYVIITLAVFNFFALMTHLHMKTLQLVKNAILITIGNPVTSFFMLVLNGIVVYISVTYMNFFFVPFFSGSVMATLSFWLFYRAFQGLQLKQMALDEQERQRSEEAARELEEAQSIDLHKSEENRPN